MTPRSHPPTSTHLLFIFLILLSPLKSCIASMSSMEFPTVAFLLPNNSPPSIKLNPTVSTSFSLSPLPTIHQIKPYPRSTELNSQKVTTNSSSAKVLPLSQNSLLNKQHGNDFRHIAQTIVAQTLCPPNEERDRSNAGMEAFGFSHSSEAITNDDPRNEYTYGEFPFESFDLLVDRALEVLFEANENGQMGLAGGGREGNIENERGNPVMVDLGSGCGRLVFYAALTRGSAAVDNVLVTKNEGRGNALWDVHGIEIGTRLHFLALNSLRRGVDAGLFSVDSCQGGTEGKICSQVMFHNGNALLVDDPYFTQQYVQDDNYHKHEDRNNSIRSILSQTNLLFAYSTVWETDSMQPFHPDMQAMILSPKWSETLASLCPRGCVAITTDRALNPEHGWRLVDRLDVENPSVWGSTGYISMLEK
ncbi:hypothetical protein ACHAXS_006977 [Conticribra weissflogii]